MSLSRGQLETLWLRAGGSRSSARTAAAVALAESGGNVGSAGDVGLGGKGPTSFGLWQVHTPAHPQYDAHRLASDPLYAARAAVAISEGGKNFAPWTTYKTGAYRPFLGAGRGSTQLPASGSAEAPQTASGGDQATLARIGELESELRGRTVPVQSPQIPLPKLLHGVAIAQGVAPQRPDTALLSAVQQLRAGLGGEGGAPQAQGEAPPIGQSGYVHPLPGAKVGRKDQGIDLSAAPGSAIRAIGNARILGISANWYKGQPYVAYELLDGPHAGKVVYNAEQITPQVRPGQRVRAGQRIGVVAPHGTALEFGWGSRALGRTQAQATTGYREGQETPAGKDFARFYEGLR